MVNGLVHAMVKIPFNRPGVAGPEPDYIADAIARGALAGGGHYTGLCHAFIEQQTGAHLALLTHSCTAALEMMVILAGLEPGDEVIMPSYTFVSTANAIVLRRAVPVFVDIRPDTLNLDEAKIEAAITDRTRAIMVVHYAGVPCAMDPIREIAARHGLLLLEDAAQAFGSTYRGTPAGALGHMAAFSFHETKNIISGEGGALALNDARFTDRAETIWQKGTNRRQFLRGMVDKYSWVDIGSSFLPSELVAAYLYGQFEHMHTILDDRMQVWKHYEQALRPLGERGFALPQIPDDCTHNAHIFQVIAPSAGLRDALIDAMRADGVETPFHYVPLHSAPAGIAHCRIAGEMRHTDDLSARLLRLPLYQGMGEERNRIVERLLHHARRLDNTSAR